MVEIYLINIGMIVGSVFPLILSKLFLQRSI